MKKAHCYWNACPVNKRAPLIFARVVCNQKKDQNSVVMGCCSSKINPFKHGHEYDLIVIGGGSGGLACAQEAAKLGAHVALCDYVTPTPKGSQWGLGGTCVNVGCIPKRLMHQSSLIKDCLNDAPLFGWKSEMGENTQVSWDELVKHVQEHVFSLNVAYRVALSQAHIKFFPGIASFVNEHEIQIEYPDSGESHIISGQCIVIAVGGRPKYLSISGGTPKDNLCITSDDIFSLPYPPGKTLCVGAGYIGVECAGFLAGFGFDVTLMARSLLLRDFDKMVVDLLSSNLMDRNVTIKFGAQPVEIQKVSEGSPPTLKVTYESKECVHHPGSRCEMEFNTVLLAVGRKPMTQPLNLEVIPRVEIDEEGYIITDGNEQTGIPNIFAIGDCAQGRPKLTPSAVQAGRWLARRIFGKGLSKLVDYSTIPTTIFSPVEYGSCGYSEEAAIKEFGEKKIEVYHKSSVPLEFSLSKRDGDAMYAKLICLKKRRKKKDEKVIGFHYFGPYAGDITVGFAMAIKRKCSKEEFNELVGIHPTCAEIFTDINVLKNSPVNFAEEKC